MSPCVHASPYVHACNALIDPCALRVAQAGTLLAVNALTIVPSPAVLRLVGPYAARMDMGLEMAKLDRTRQVSITGLLDAGFRRVGWLHPGEQPGGIPVC